MKNVETVPLPFQFKRSTSDLHSYSQPDQVRVRHIDLDLTPSFERRTIEGSVVLSVEKSPGHLSAPLVLDTRSLDLHAVAASADGESFRDAKYEIGPEDPILGAALTIDLLPQESKVRIRYSTASDATALQWLSPAQTAGKRFPFLYTQSQAIHARSWIPIQDTPRIRMTYTARVRTPMGLCAVMSVGNNPKADCKDFYAFHMERPVPPYLIALAIGEIGFAPTGTRTGVYAELPLLQSAAYEFADAEKMLETAEQLYGPYLWGRFDTLVLPPSFPFGGMENPSLIFVTPTLIAGDRSSVSVIAHELAHAWSGNLVTNATWSDFWLNEGFTTYIERRIQEHLYGKARAEIEEVLAQERLAEEMGKLELRDQVLHVDLTGRDPDSGTTLVPYVKGALFLKSLEKAFGRPRFDQYLKSYFAKFAFQSITTEEALTYLKNNLLDRYPEVAVGTSVQEWIYEPGIPASAPLAVSESLDRIRKQAEDFQPGAKSLPSNDWGAHERLHFLRSLPLDLGSEGMRQLDQALHLTATRNSEILQQWLLMAVRNLYAPAYPRLEEFLTTVGRRIYIKPLYEELVKTDPGKKFAQTIYSRVRDTYHPISQAAIDKIVGVPKGSEPLS
jgi:aminopeptidase N